MISKSVDKNYQKIKEIQKTIMLINGNNYQAIHERERNIERRRKALFRLLNTNAMEIALSNPTLEEIQSETELYKKEIKKLEMIEQAVKELTKELIIEMRMNNRGTK